MWHTVKFQWQVPVIWYEACDVHLRNVLLPFHFIFSCKRVFCTIFLYTSKILQLLTIYSKCNPSIFEMQNDFHTSLPGKEGDAFSSPEAAILNLVSTKNPDIWGLELTHSTHCLLSFLYFTGQSHNLRKKGDWPEDSILSPDQKDGNLWDREGGKG